MSQHIVWHVNKTSCFKYIPCIYLFLIYCPVFHVSNLTVCFLWDYILLEMIQNHASTWSDSLWQIKGTWCSSSFKIISVYMDETQRPQSERCEHWVYRALWWTITHAVITLLGLCQQPHAHSPRLTLPFTYSVSIHKQALVYCNVSVAANKNCRERKLSDRISADEEMIY